MASHRELCNDKSNFVPKWFGSNLFDANFGQQDLDEFPFGVDRTASS